jgi:hypothetical protein
MITGMSDMSDLGGQQQQDRLAQQTLEERVTKLEALAERVEAKLAELLRRLAQEAERGSGRGSQPVG